MTGIKFGVRWPDFDVPINKATIRDFVQAADPLDPSRVNVFERWDTEDDLLAFRGAGQPAHDSPPIRSADVMRYIISSVEDP